MKIEYNRQEIGKSKIFYSKYKFLNICVARIRRFFHLLFSIKECSFDGYDEKNKITIIATCDITFSNNYLLKKVFWVENNS